MHAIEILNRRLGDARGRISNAPRFQWAWAPDLTYFHRNESHESWTWHSWAERLGRVWVLAQVRTPVGMQGDLLIPITREQWWASFQGQFPFPGNLTLHPFPETALRPGLVPDEQDTAFYIHSLASQMEKSMRQIKAEIQEGLDKAELDNRKEFMAMADDSFPAFWSSAGGAHTPGARGGHVCFQS